MATRSREKAALRAANKDRRPKAKARYIRIAPRKVRVVIDQIRGKKVEEAQAILMFTPKIASPVIAKVLDSAIANAENNLELDRDRLFVAECYVDQGPTLKRFRAHSRGMARRINKRTSHITVILDQAK